MKRFMFFVFLLAAGLCLAQNKSGAEGGAFREFIYDDQLGGTAEIKLVSVPGVDPFLGRLSGEVTLAVAEDCGLVECSFPFPEAVALSRIARKGALTKEAWLDMYSVTGVVDVRESFKVVTRESLSGKGIDDAVMSQHQIVQFCTKNAKWIKGEYDFVDPFDGGPVHPLPVRMFFLTRVKKKHFVVCVESKDDKMTACSFELPGEWGELATGCFFIVCPHIERVAEEHE